MRNHRQPDLFASRKPRAARRKAEGDRLITRRELRASLALYSPSGTAAVPDDGGDPDEWRRMNARPLCDRGDRA